MLLDTHHLSKQTNKSISNSWFQAFQIKNLRNLKKILKIEEVYLISNQCLIFNQFLSWFTAVQCFYFGKLVNAFK